MQMQKTTLIPLLLAFYFLIVNGDATQSIDTSKLTSVGTADLNGSKLRVFEINGVQVAEPRITFGDTCDSLRYSNLYLKYQLALTIKLDVNSSLTSKSGSKVAGQVTVEGMNVDTDQALIRKDAKLIVIMKPTKSAEYYQLIFLCDTFVRCQQLQDDISSNPEEIWGALTFKVVAKISGSLIKFGPLRSANFPMFNCAPDRWVVFQRRVDGSLSFAKNWDAYVKGFGNSKSNYWMGLEKLFQMTVTGQGSTFAPTARCRLRIEVEDFTGTNYWGEYTMFQVLSAEQNYRLRVGGELTGSQLAGLSNHSDMQFSTYDRDNDKYGPDSCSRMYGFGGWWYNSCYAFNLNGAYLTDKSIRDSPTYNSVLLGGKYLPMKRTLMKFKCD